jgi:N-acylglucosamine-6-phosphate 2-epimerase
VTAPLPALAGRLIVSCQAAPGHPLHPPEVLALLARCAEMGGAAAVRLDGPAAVAAARAAVGVPVVGLHKVLRPGGRPWITPAADLAAGLVRAGADLVAVEAATDLRPAADVAALLTRLTGALGVPVLADVATVEDGVRAWDCGAALVATTLSGYAPGSPDTEDPDLELVGALAGKGIRTVAEGRYRTPEQVAAAFEHGAYAVVVGTAITDPAAITARLTAATPAAAAGPAPAPRADPTPTPYAGTVPARRTDPVGWPA